MLSTGKHAEVFQEQSEAGVPLIIRSIVGISQLQEARD